MKSPIPLKVMVTPPELGFEWLAMVQIDVPGYGSGTASGETVGEAIGDALMVALTTGPEPQNMGQMLA